MTPEERKAVLSLVVAPHGPPPADPAEVLRQLGSSDGRELGAELLRDALARRDPVDVEMALIISSVFGVSPNHLEPLLSLATADWHYKHEDVASALGRLRSPKSVEVLRHLAQWVPDYLSYDDSRALAVKAVYALGAIPGSAADDALTSLLDSDSQVVRRQASKQLERRRPS